MALMHWLTGTAGEKASSPAQTQELQTLGLYLSMVLRSLVLVTAVLAVFVLLSALRLPAGFDVFGLAEHFTVELKLDGQTLASYVAAALGTVVALAGSLVAIILALRAQNTSEQTERLQRQANQLAEASRPEYAQAFEAASGYAALKGSIVLAPLALRRLQRNTELGVNDLLDLQRQPPELVALQASLSGHLFQSPLATLLPTLASRVPRHPLLRQRLMQTRLAAVHDSGHVMPALAACLALTREVDQLLEELDAEVRALGLGLDSFTQDRRGLQRHASLQGLTETEYWFLRHARPFSAQDRHLSFDLIDLLMRQAKEKFLRQFGLYPLCPLRQLALPDPAPGCKPVVCLGMDDSLLYEVQLSLLNLLPQAQVRAVASGWDVAIADALRDEHAGQLDAARPRVLVLDQVDLYVDSAMASSSKFGLEAQLRFWRLCESYRDWLDAAQEADPERRAACLRQVHRDCQAQQDLAAWAGWRDGKQAGQVDDILRAAAQARQASLVTFDGSPMLRMSLFLFLCTVNRPVDEFTAAPASPPLAATDRVVLDELCRVPLFERPIYAWHCLDSAGYPVLEPVPARQFSGTWLVVNAYLNSDLTIRRPLMLAWLLRGVGLLNAIYWA